MAPALISAIKVAGLVVIANTSSSPRSTQLRLPGRKFQKDFPQSLDGVNGTLDQHRILTFYHSIDM